MGGSYVIVHLRNGSRKPAVASSAGYRCRRHRTCIKLYFLKVQKLPWRWNPYLRCRYPRTRWVQMVCKRLHSSLLRAPYLPWRSSPGNRRSLRPDGNRNRGRSRSVPWQGKAQGLAALYYDGRRIGGLFYRHVLAHYRHNLLNGGASQAFFTPAAHRGFAFGHDRANNSPCACRTRHRNSRPFLRESAPRNFGQNALCTAYHRPRLRRRVNSVYSLLSDC